MTVRSNAGTKTDALAFYASGTYSPTPALSLTAGGRWTSEKRAVDMVSYNGAGLVTFAPTHKEKTFRKFVPSASLRLEVAPRTNIYASYSQGFPQRRLEPQRPGPARSAAADPARKHHRL